MRRTLDSTGVSARERTKTKHSNSSVPELRSTHGKPPMRNSSLNPSMEEERSLKYESILRSSSSGHRRRRANDVTKRPDRRRTVDGSGYQQGLSHQHQTPEPMRRSWASPTSSPPRPRRSRNNSVRLSTTGG